MTSGPSDGIASDELVLSEKVDQMEEAQTEHNPWRDEIVKTIFGDVGCIRKDFSCAIERKILLHGRMYVTDRFICFYSNLFGFEKKIKIPYSHINCVTKENTAGIIPNAIAIITAKREYVFRSFWDRDDCFSLLTECHDASRGVVAPHAALNEVSSGPVNSTTVAPDSSHRAAGDAPAAPSKPQRSNSSRSPSLSRDSSSSTSSGAGAGASGGGPASGGASGGGGGGGGAVGDDAGEVDPTGGAAPSPPPTRAHKAKSASVLCNGTPASPPLTGSSKATGSGASARKSAPAGGLTLGGSASLSSDGGAGTAAAEEEEGGTENVGSDPAGEFARARAQNCLYEAASAVMPIPMERFFDDFLQPGALNALPSFHESRGDSELDAKEESWDHISGSTDPKADTVVTRSRTFRFRTPLSAPIGPSSTRATKTQCYRTYAGHGQVCETVTTLEDIPFGDCFTVNDRWLITPCNNADGRPGCKVVISCDLKWVKKTMWKRTIESKTVKDVKDFFECYLQGALAKLQSRGDVPVAAVACASPAKPPQRKSRSSAASKRSSSQAQSHRAVAPPQQDPRSMWFLKAMCVLLALCNVLLVVNSRTAQAGTTQELHALRSAHSDTGAAAAAAQASLLDEVRQLRHQHAQSTQAWGTLRDELQQLRQAHADGAGASGESSVDAVLDELRQLRQEHALVAESAPTRAVLLDELRQLRRSVKDSRGGAVSHSPVPDTQATVTVDPGEGEGEPMLVSATE